MLPEKWCIIFMLHTIGESFERDGEYGFIELNHLAKSNVKIQSRKNIIWIEMQEHKNLDIYILVLNCLWIQQALYLLKRFNLFGVRF